jgi:hypothetical protein
MITSRNMKPVKPNKPFEQSWLSALQEFEEENVGGFWNVPEKANS